MSKDLRLTPILCPCCGGKLPRLTEDEETIVCEYCDTPLYVNANNEVEKITNELDEDYFEYEVLDNISSEKLDTNEWIEVKSFSMPDKKQKVHSNSSSVLGKAIELSHERKLENDRRKHELRMEKERHQHELIMEERRKAEEAEARKKGCLLLLGKAHIRISCLHASARMKVSAIVHL